MAKNDKLGIDKIINRINQEFEKTSSQFDKLVSDALKQFDSLQSQVQDPIKKLMDDMDKIRDRELKRFHSEFDRRVEEFTELQNSILEKLGMSTKKEPPKKTVKPTVKTTAPKKAPKAAPKKAVKKPATAKVAKSAATTKATPKKATPKKATAKKAPAQKAVKDTDLTKLAGVGPAMAKKLNEAGINSLKQVSAPTEDDKKVLSDFAKVKGFESWEKTAKELIG